MIDPTYTGESGKLGRCFSHAESAMAEGHKLLVFSQFVKHLDIVKEFLYKQKVPFAYLDGSSNDRKDQVEKIQQRS
ncbi:MAG: helicase-related protein [Bacteroidota bacterium]